MLFNTNTDGTEILDNGAGGVTGARRAVETQNFASLRPPHASQRMPDDGLGKTDVDPAKFRGKYRIPAARKRTWDYGSNAAYFVTICTKNREPYFGTINEESLAMASMNDNDCTRMHMTEIGEAARRCWLAIPDHFPFVQLDVFVVMPDHVHGIIVIGKHDGERGDGWHVNAFAPQSKNLASIIRGFKIGVTKFAREHDLAFGWQTRYHDRIAREDDNIGLIRFYIESNPLRCLNGMQSNNVNAFLSSD